MGQARTRATTAADDTGQPAPSRAVGWLLTIGGLLGLTAAVTLTVEKMHLLADPSYQPSCSINPILSCGSVMTTPQAEAFGLPNPLIGVAAYPVLITLGVVLLGGVRLPRGLWLGLQAGSLLGVVFVHWLIFQSLYRIGALCPYCMVVWAVTIAIFWYVTVDNLRHRRLSVPVSLTPLARAAVESHSFVLVLWFLTIVVLIGARFWSYWRTLLP